jgi:beta-N-acetylhexosaminidase
MLNLSIVRKVSLTIFVVVTTFSCFSQTRERWVDSVFQSLSTEAKIGQILIMRASPSNSDDVNRILDNIKSYHIGGVIIMRTGPLSHGRFVNTVQSKSPVPLLLGIEGVRGPGFSMDSITQIPPPLILNALRNDSLVTMAAKEIARQMKLLQLNINFMPLANVDIDQGSSADKLLHFGSPSGYLRVAGVFITEMQDEGIIACAQQDLRWDALLSKRSELLYRGTPDTTLFNPYKQLITRGLSGVMTTRLPYFYVEQNKGLPAFVSQLFVSENIQRGLGFNGLTFTDIPSLQQVVAKPRGGETETLAFQVGNDFLIDPANLSATVKKIKKSLKKNLPLQQHLDSTVRKILFAKYDAGLARRKPIELDNIVTKLNSTSLKVLNQKIYRESITLVTNESGHAPVKGLAGKKFAVISIGMETENPFAEYLSKYAPITKYSIRLPEDTSKLSDFGKYDHVIVASFPFAENLLPGVMPSVNRIAAKSSAVVFGDPTQLRWFDSFGTVLAGYTDAAIVQHSAAEIVFGAIGARGRLPLTASDKWREGTGSSIELMNRLGYGLPEEVGIDSKSLERIAQIAREAVDSASTPGCHILVARKGKIVFDRSFGWYTYENKTPVMDETIYDLASLTKVMATLQAVMYLTEKGYIDVNKKASVYLPELVPSNKKDITLKDMLTHQSGLLPFIPMWPQTIRDKEPDPYYYSATRDEMYPMQVAPNLFVAPIIGDSAWHWAVQSRLLNKTPRTPFSYRYSDMGSMILHRMANRVMNEPMEKFLRRYFYEPLGAETLGFNPLERLPANQIAPSEIDTLYRKSILLGTVNDERAAMLGGVAGHAGLFGNAIDLAKMCQMLLNGGSYGGVQFLKPETVEMFANKQYENSHRGLGWDKPLTSEWNGSTSELASPRTFGHTGFTGTCIWIDPEFDLVYIFLSNRVWPGRSTKLLRTNVRTRIQTAIYRSIFDYCQFQE